MRFPRSPFLWAVLAGLAVLLAAFVPVLWQMMQLRPVSSVAELPAPWQIERGPQGEVRALGPAPAGVHAGRRRRALG
jgi:hypothetical protein